MGASYELYTGAGTGASYDNEAAGSGGPYAGAAGAGALYAGAGAGSSYAGAGSAGAAGWAGAGAGCGGGLYVSFAPAGSPGYSKFACGRNIQISICSNSTLVLFICNFREIEHMLCMYKPGRSGFPSMSI